MVLTYNIDHHVVAFIVLECYVFESTTKHFVECNHIVIHPCKSRQPVDTTHEHKKTHLQVRSDTIIIMMD